MSTLKIVAIAVIVLGVLGLVYGGFTYRRQTHSARVGSLEMSVTSDRAVNIPLWAGVGAIVVGGALLFVPRGKG